MEKPEKTVSGSEEARRLRQAEALRENLRRRKDQARARDDEKSDEGMSEKPHLQDRP